MFWLIPWWKVNRVFTGVLPRRRRLKKLLSLSDQEGGSPPRGHLSLSSSWVELYAVCFLSCVPVWPCCLTTVVNPRSFFFETSLCFLSNSLGWFESKLVADCWCYCFQVLFLTSSYGGLGPGVSQVLQHLQDLVSSERSPLTDKMFVAHNPMQPQTTSWAQPTPPDMYFSKNATSKGARFWGGWRLFDTISTCSNMFCTNISAKYQFCEDIWRWQL